MFYGPSGWKLNWEEEDKLWKISNERYPGLQLITKTTNNDIFLGVTANVTETKYPVGSHQWIISGDGCQSQPYHSLLTLSACTKDQFTCDDGLCVEMTTRRVINCQPVVDSFKLNQ